MPTFTHADLSLCFDVRGAPELPPLVLLHGLGYDQRMWHQVACALISEYRVVTMDLRGHGCSSAPEEPDAYALEQQAGDVAALAAHLGLELFALGGWDIGGAVALHVAGQLPERVAALVLADTAVSPRRLRPPADDLDVARRYGTRMLGRRRAQEMQGEFLQEALAWTYGRQPADGLTMAAAAWQAQPAGPPPPLAMPVLLMRSGGSPLGDDMAGLAEALPDARYVTVRDADDVAPIYRADETTRVLRGFLRDVEEGRPAGGAWQV